MNLELGLFVFMLATFVGLEVIRKVSPLLHTPLMSLTNAISAISVVGAILITGAAGATMLSKVLGFIAITAAVTNIVSGFLITDRMVKMFKKRGGEEVMAHLVQYIYIVSAALFILSLKWMNSPATARRGVFAGEIGMLLAVVARSSDFPARWPESTTSTTGNGSWRPSSSAPPSASPSPTSCR